MVEYAFRSYKHIRNSNISFEQDDVDISYLVSSKYHWKFITIQVRRVLVPTLERHIIVCNSSVKRCCTGISTAADNLQNFYQSHFTSGEWINCGNRLEEPENDHTKTCKQRQGALQSHIDRCNDHAGPHDPVPTSNDASDQSTVSLAYKKFVKGLCLLRDHNAGLTRRIDFKDEVDKLRSKLNARSDLDQAATGLTMLQQQSRGLAEAIDWKWEHLIRCIRILQRNRGSMTTSDDPDGIGYRQEKSACRINQLIDNLSSYIGPSAMVVYSAFSAVNFVWDGIGRVEPSERVKKIIDDVCEAVLDTGFQFPESTSLFNPAATLSWLLGESQLCQELSLGNLSRLDLNVGIGVFREIPLNSIMERVDHRSPFNLRLKDNQREWVLAGQNINKATEWTASKKRKRIASAAQPVKDTNLSSSQVESLIDSRSHTRAFPDWMMDNYDAAEQNMTQPGSFHNLPGPVGILTATPGISGVDHTLWSRTGSTGQGDGTIVHDPFMGNIIPSYDLANIGSSNIRTYGI